LFVGVSVLIRFGIKLVTCMMYEYVYDFNSGEGWNNILYYNQNCSLLMSGHKLLSLEM